MLLDKKKMFFHSLITPLWIFFFLDLSSHLLIYSFIYSCFTLSIIYQFMYSFISLFISHLLPYVFTFFVFFTYDNQNFYH